MGGNRSPRRKIAAGRGDVRAPDAGQQRTEQQHRPAQPTHQRPVRDVTADFRRAYPQRRAPDAIDLGAEIQQQTRHHFDVADPGNVGQHALVFSQQAGGEQRQRRILVALDRDTSLQPVPAFNQQCRHLLDRLNWWECESQRASNSGPATATTARPPVRLEGPHLEVSCKNATSGSSSNPTNAGSGLSQTPKRSPTCRLICTARASTSRAVAPPRLTIASGCLDEIPAPPEW